MNEELAGVAHGRNREQIIDNARAIGALYFGTDPANIRVELFEERVDGGVHQTADGRLAPAAVMFDADFTAERIDR